MKVFIENGKVRFTQGVQTFTLSYDDETNLEWMADQLRTAFENFKIESIAQVSEETQVARYILEQSALQTPERKARNRELGAKYAQQDEQEQLNQER